METTPRELGFVQRDGKESIPQSVKHAVDGGITNRRDDFKQLARWAKRHQCRAPKKGSAEALGKIQRYPLCQY